MSDINAAAYHAVCALSLPQRCYDEECAHALFVAIRNGQQRSL